MSNKEVDESIPNPMFIRDKERMFIKLVSDKSTKDIKLAIGYIMQDPDKFASVSTQRIVFWV
jgi:hypothetical protein